MGLTGYTNGVLHAPPLIGIRRRPPAFRSATRACTAAPGRVIVADSGRLPDRILALRRGVVSPKGGRA